MPIKLPILLTQPQEFARLSPLGFSQSPALLGTITQLNSLAPFVPSDKQPSPPLPATIQLELGFVCPLSKDTGFVPC